MLNDEKVVKKQYENAGNLSTRISIHDKYSTNKMGFANWIFSNYEIEPGMKILELGCGTGSMWKGREELIKTCGKIVLSDFSEGMVETTRANVGVHENVEYRVIDVQDIPYERESFDVVIANMMLYHVPDLDLGLREVNRVLKKGGRFYAATYGEHGIVEYLALLLGKYGVEDTASKAFTLQNGKGILEKRFSNVEMRRYEDALAVTNVDDLVDYAYSLASMTSLASVPREVIRDTLALQMRDGVLHVPKEYGMFLAKKKEPLWDAELDVEERLAWLIGELTLEEKLHLLSSGSGGIERLGIPDCRLGGEAAHGVEARNDQNGIGTPEITTSFPQPIGMSSSWDCEAIRAAGEIVGKEARIVYNRRPWGGISRWAPTVDLLRDPRWGRNEEAYGEDPVQVGTMASAYVRGIQGDDREHLRCAATLKHFYANNTEIGRGWKNVSMSPRNKYELYLEPFRRCIEDGGVEGVMTAYNRINGVQGLFNEDVKNLLKEEFGLVHAVSDGGAMELSASFSHATAMDAETVARSIKAGVDALSGRPDGVYAAASEAFELGLLTEEDVNEAIKNVYRTKIRLGLLDADKYGEELGDTCSDKAREVCKSLTDKSIVLLKNDGILPLKETLKDCVLIGPVGDKWYMDWYGGEAPEHVTLLDGLNDHARQSGCGELAFLDGCDRVVLKCGEFHLAADAEGRYRLSESPEVFVMEDWGEGSYTFRNERTGKYLITELADDVIDGGDETGAAPARIAGKVKVGKDRIFSWFDLEVFRRDEDLAGKEPHAKGAMRDRFGNQLFADREGFVVSALSACGGLRELPIEIEILQNGVEEAVSAARDAGTVILALGHHPMVNAKEEIDRSTIEFIPYQQRLFDEIHKVNPNVVVVLTSNYPFAIQTINEKARGILWSATGSQCMGRSLADAVMGKVSPAGRLTQTWLRSDDDLPDIDDYDVIGKGRTYRYFEGEPLYPFGHGLTYVSFSYGDLSLAIDHVKKPGKKTRHHKTFGQPNGAYDHLRSDDRVLRLELTVTNTGEYVSDEVVQVYAKPPKGTVKKPGRQLIGFERVREIAPGEARRIKLLIPVRELAFYDVIRETLIVEEGDYEITAAPSSQAPGSTVSVWLEGEKPKLRDLTKRIKADHYDEECGSQIVEGLYGYCALTAAGPSVYEPNADGRFVACYANCQIPGESQALRIHGFAPDNATVRVYVDDLCVGELTLNTKEYEKRSAPARNHLSREQADEAMRRQSFPILWADIDIPLDLSGIKEMPKERGHVLRIEAQGPFKYDWFMMRQA